MDKIQKVSELCIYKQFRFKHYYPTEKDPKHIYHPVNITTDHDEYKFTFTLKYPLNTLGIESHKILNLLEKYNGQLEGICLKGNGITGTDLRKFVFTDLDNLISFLDVIDSIMMINKLK